MTDKLKKLWQAMADHTRPVCMSDRGDRARGDCLRPGSCCSPEYCDMAMQIADEQGVFLVLTDHPSLPLMGPQGCVAPPHVRPLCTLHVCCINSAGFKPGDETWTRKYFEIRSMIDKETYESETS